MEAELLSRSPLWLATLVLLVLVELTWRKRTRRGYDGRAALATFGLVLGNIPFALLNGTIIGGVFLAAASLAPVQWPLHDWRSWAAGFLLFEFAYYWFHRASHHVRWLWASHAVHHSAEQMTLLASLRLGWTSGLSLGWVFYLPLLLAGCPPLMLAALRAFDLRYQFLLHTEAVGKLGPLEWVLNTPSHHRVHHAANQAYLDRNFGGVLIIFDRLFGTFAEERTDERPLYGVLGKPASYNPVQLALREWRAMARDLWAAPSLRAGLRALLVLPDASAAQPSRATSARAASETSRQVTSKPASLPK